MAQFRFIGDPRDNGSGPDTIDVHGHSFGRDAFTEVAHEGVAAKLRKHSHFEEMASDAEEEAADGDDAAPAPSAPKKRGRKPKAGA